MQGRFAVTAETIVGLAHLAALRRLDTAYMMAPQEAPASLDEFAALTGALPRSTAHQAPCHPALGECGRWYGAVDRAREHASSGSPVKGLQSPALQVRTTSGTCPEARKCFCRVGHLLPMAPR